MESETKPWGIESSWEIHGSFHQWMMQARNKSSMRTNYLQSRIGTRVTTLQAWGHKGFGFDSEIAPHRRNRIKIIL